MPTQALTDTAIRKSKPAATIRRIADGQGLSLEITPNGSKHWRYRFRDAAGKAQMLSLGSYPDVTLAQARVAHQAMRDELRSGVDVGSKRK